MIVKSFGAAKNVTGSCHLLMAKTPYPLSYFAGIKDKALVLCAQTAH